MASHRVLEILELTPRSDDKADVFLRLRCGCSVRTTVRSARVVSNRRAGRTLGGQTISGWFACPVGHPRRL